MAFVKGIGVAVLCGCSFSLVLGLGAAYLVVIAQGWSFSDFLLTSAITTIVVGMWALPVALFFGLLYGVYSLPPCVRSQILRLNPGSSPFPASHFAWSPMRCRLTGGMALSPSRNDSVEGCEKRLGQPLQSIGCDLPRV